MSPSRCLASGLAAAFFRVSVLGLLAAGAGGAQAAPAPQVWMAVSDRALDTQRGGFSFGGGLEVSFGIARAVFINGELITETVLSMARMADITPEWASRLRAELQSITLVQNGPGNTFVSAPAGAVAEAVGATQAAGATVSAIAGTASGTVIQNSLNNQHILHQTIITATSNALGMLRLASLHSSLSEAIRESVGQR